MITMIADDTNYYKIHIQKEHLGPENAAGGY